MATRYVNPIESGVLWIVHIQQTVGKKYINYQIALQHTEYEH